MKRDDMSEEGEKRDLSRSQFYLVVASIAVIVVLAFALVRLLKTGPESAQKPEPAPAQTVATPPSGGTEMLSSLPAPNAAAPPKKAETQPAAAAPKAPAPKAAPAAPAPKAAAPQAAPSPTTPAPKATAPAKTGLDGSPIPRAATTAPVPAKPKVKTAEEIRRIKSRPLHKEVNVKLKKTKRAVEQRHAQASKPEAPAPSDNGLEKLSKKPDESSFVTEAVRPPPEAYAPATSSATVAPPAPTEAKPEIPKKEAKAVAEAAKTSKPEFTLLVNTFKAEAEAKDYAQELKKKGYKAFITKKETTKSTWYQVMTGEFADREAADKAAGAFLEKEGVRSVVQPYPAQ